MKQKKYYSKIYDVNTWLTLHITQLTNNRNIIMTFAIGVTGYAIANYPSIDKYVTIVNLIMGIGLILLMFSLYLGLSISVFEEENFRLKRTISRMVAASKLGDEDDLDNKEFEKEEKVCTTLERKNKHYFKNQMFFFLIGTVVIGIIFYLDKIKTI